MSVASDFVASDILNTTLATGLYLGLLTADPIGDTATAASNEATFANFDGSYLRQAVNFVPSTTPGENGDRVHRNDAQIDFAAVADTSPNYTVLYVAVWDANTAGNLLYVIPTFAPLTRIAAQPMSFLVDAIALRVL